MTNTGDCAECCPQFEPGRWDQQTISWAGKKFVKDRVRCFLHIPLNFGSVMKRNVARIERAKAKSAEMIVLTDDNSLWGADVYIDVTAEVPGAPMATLNGTYLSRVFEGPYRDVPKWMREMGAYVQGQGKTAKKLYTYYTTCPRCAKARGKNYVVMLAEVA